MYIYTLVNGNVLFLNIDKKNKKKKFSLQNMFSFVLAKKRGRFSFKTCTSFAFESLYFMEDELLDFNNVGINSFLLINRQKQRIEN